MQSADDRGKFMNYVQLMLQRSHHQLQVISEAPTLLTSNMIMERNGSMYLFLSSVDSINYFPDNVQANFQIKLDTALMLDEYWYVALCEIQYRMVVADMSRSLSVYCTLSRPTVIKDRTDCIIRRFARRGSQEFRHRQYFPIVQRYVERIGIHILDDKDRIPSFLNEPVEITLHLKRAVNHHFL